MAATKFAAMLHKNTNKITLILIYTVLEWTLILLLLFNSLFSFLIIKFSQYFGLKRPCLWCSTLHRFFEPENENSCKDLLCELHSKEVSNLGFCSNHQKLAEIKDLCEDCLFSHLGFQFEVKQSDEIDVKLKCSCCGFDFSSRIRTYWDVLGCIKEGIEKNSCLDDQVGSDLKNENLEIETRGEKFVRDLSCFETDLNRFEKRDDSCSDFLRGDLEFFFDFSGHQLVPIELVDSTTEESQNISEADEEQEFGDYQKGQGIQEHENRELRSTDMEESENSLVFHAKLSDSTNGKSTIVEETQPLFNGTEELQENAMEKNGFESDFHMGFRSKNSSGNHNEIEEDKILDTPGSIESVSQLHKKLLMIKRKEYEVDESSDGSVTSEMDDLVNTAEKLKSALKSERAILHALYSELEEERGASAIATSETMAMINRLQEEKATVQIEALQYQRMMEEQSEYDQEALQLLNELMLKKDKELELYRKKVADYEVRFSQGNVKRGTCSASCSHSEDGEGTPIEINYELDRFDGNRENWHQESSNTAVLDLESSLVDFEEERLSILEQLKVLEEKLFFLSDEEDQHFAEVRLREDFHEENGKDYEFDGTTNRFPKDTTNSLIEKKLLPLLDVINTEKDNGITVSNECKNGLRLGTLENGAIVRLELEKKRIDIEMEVDQVYGRLQADREFLKYCIGSLKKGDKGMERDLQTKTFTDETLAQSILQISEISPHI